MLGLILTLIELMCGLIFIWYFKLDLWDYEKNCCNYKGLVCLKFSVCWAILGFVSVMLFFPNVDFEKFNIKGVLFFMYLFYAIFISDVLYNLFYLFYIKYFNKCN